MKWLTIIVVCLIFSLVSEPVKKFIFKRINNRHFAYFMTFMAYLIIFMSLYEIAALMGFDISE